MASVMSLSMQLFDDLTMAAGVSPRGRQHHNLHAHYDEPCQRLLNAISVSSYIPPHRHALDPKHESLICVRGLFGLLIFDEDGGILERMPIGNFRTAAAGAELPPGAWHTVVALEPGSILLELKAGPFNPNAAKELACWAPDEGTSEARVYLAKLRAEFKDLVPYQA